MIVLRIMMMGIFWLKIPITFKSLKKSDYDDAVKDRERELDLNIEDCKLHCIDCIELQRPEYRGLQRLLQSKQGSRGLMGNSVALRAPDFHHFSCCLIF